MKLQLIKWSLTFLGVLLFSFPALATTQWTRKTGMSCNSCHSVFPRLNQFGEQYQKNGYQDPTTQGGDGDIAQKKINESLTVPKVEDYFGVRLNYTPAKLDTNKVQIGADRTNLRNQWTLGNNDWVQFFVAGSVFKDVSIFIEMEHQVSSFKFSWSHLGFHNLGGTTMANVRVGNISAVEWASFTNRLPIFVALKNKGFQQVNTTGNSDTTGLIANGTADDALDISSARPGLEYYGYTGPLTWWTGVSSGSTAANSKNTLVNIWGGLKGEITDAMGTAFQGSSVSFWAERGGDAKNVTTAGSELYRTSNYTRYQAATNLRWGSLDAQAAYIWANFDDWNLGTAGANPASYKSYAFQSGYLIDKFYPGLMFDKVVSSGAKANANDPTTISPMLRYMIRENMHITGYATFDLNEASAHKKSNSYLLNIRTMI